MSRNLKVSVGLIVAAVIAVLVAVLAGGDGPAAAPSTSGDDPLVRSDSQRLSVGDTDVTFVEFLDFECEACRAAHPAIEELRQIYGDRVTFVVRNFPLHENSEAAAQAAEAAAAQGEYEAMYNLLFETQPDWGEKSTSQRDVFFGFAADLGLDMDEFTAVYEAEETIDLIRRDKADGTALGVTGTPSFFLEGEKIEPSSFEELITEFDAALES
ncbi:DsbA family protein [Ilumatobacter nonamiensis]|uniref:DsbA family protein n=1 Tax=Ilumatobacter nonamiensis TaxID=467093 RepID=UPI00034BF943|nr:thioredoxin domain-containing protein [Ilumatobacter nonamiensis]